MIHFHFSLPVLWAMPYCCIFCSQRSVFKGQGIRFKTNACSRWSQMSKWKWKFEMHNFHQIVYCERFINTAKCLCEQVETILMCQDQLGYSTKYVNKMVWYWNLIEHWMQIYEVIFNEWCSRGSQLIFWTGC